MVIKKPTTTSSKTTTSTTKKPMTTTSTKKTGTTSSSGSTTKKPTSGSSSVVKKPTGPIGSSGGIKKPTSGGSSGSSKSGSKSSAKSGTTSSKAQSQPIAKQDIGKKQPFGDKGSSDKNTKPFIKSELPPDYSQYLQPKLLSSDMMSLAANCPLAQDVLLALKHESCSELEFMSPEKWLKGFALYGRDPEWDAKALAIVKLQKEQQFSKAVFNQQLDRKYTSKFFRVPNYQGQSPVITVPISEIDPSAYLPNPDYDRRYVDRSWITEIGLYPYPLDFRYLFTDWYNMSGAVSLLAGLAVGYQIGDGLTRDHLLQLAQISASIGNDDAARNLLWFINANGAPMTDYPVDKMLNELNLFNLDVGEINSTSLPGLLWQTVPTFQGPSIQLRPPTYVTSDGYGIYVNTAGLTYAPDDPNNPTPELPRWRRVGQGSGSNLYTGARATDDQIFTNNGTNIDISPNPFAANSSFSFMYNSVDPASVGAPFSREQFDSFIAQGAFDYSIAQVIVVAPDGNATLYHRVDLADEYAWYINEGTGTVDRVMAELDLYGYGELYEIRGSSSIYTTTFHIEDDLDIESWSYQLPPHNSD